MVRTDRTRGQVRTGKDRPPVEIARKRAAERGRGFLGARGASLLASRGICIEKRQNERPGLRRRERMIARPRIAKKSVVGIAKFDANVTFPRLAQRIRNSAGLLGANVLILA